MKARLDSNAKRARGATGGGFRSSSGPFWDIDLV